MRNARLMIYLMGAVYAAMMLIIGFQTSEEYVRRFFLGDNEPATFYGINVYFRSIFLLLTALFFLISHLISRKKKNAKRNRYFYLSQVFFFFLIAMNVRFNLEEALTSKHIIVVFILAEIEVLIFIFWGAFFSMKKKEKNKIYTVVIILLFAYLVKYFGFYDKSLQIIIHNLLLFWSSLVMCLFSWDIMYHKIRKLKKHANEKTAEIGNVGNA